MTQIVSSISGLEIYAPSAGNAPTNSADVSAIASGYQVVSSTGTQLYAGTAFLTGVNGTPVSASRAGQAANASMANSAYYDGTGRLISSLPDSAAVSSIASSYAESAVSSKADSSALSSYALSADVSSCIDTVSSNSATWGGGATGDYVEKSSYQHCLGTANTLLNTSTASLYLINGSGISANVGGYVQLINGSRNTAQANAFINGYGNFAAGGGSILGTNSHVTGMSLAVGSQNTINGAALTVGNRNTAYGNSMCIGAYNSASAVGYAFGSGLKIKNYALALGAYNSASDGTNVALVIGDGYVYNDGAWHTANHDLMVVTKDGEITLYSSTADTTGTGIMSSIRAISASATGVVDTVSGNSASWGAGASLPITGAQGDYSASHGISSVDFTYGEDGGASNLYTGSFNVSSVFIEFTPDNEEFYSTELTHNYLNFTGPNHNQSMGPSEIEYWNDVANTVSTESGNWGGATGDYVEKSATEVAIGSANTASSTSMAQGQGNSATACSFVQGNVNTAWSGSFAQGVDNSADTYSFAQGYYNSASNGSFAQGNHVSAQKEAAVFGRYNLHGNGSTAATGESAAFVIGDGKSTARHDLMVVTKDGEITMYSSTADTTGTGIMSAIRAISAAATGGGGGGIDSATCSAIASSYAESAASSRMYSSAMQVVANSSQATANGVLYILTGGV